MANSEIEMASDEPSREFSKKYLMAMIFSSGSENSFFGKSEVECQNYASKIIHTMTKAGIDVFPYISESKTKIIVLINVTETKSLLFKEPISPLHKFADKINFSMIMDETKLEQAMLHGGPNIVGRVNITYYTLLFVFLMMIIYADLS